MDEFKCFSKYFLFSIILFNLIGVCYSSSFVLSGDSTVTIYRVQVAACSTYNEAGLIKQRIIDNGITPSSIDSSGNWYRVLAGCWASRSESTTPLNQLKTLGYADAFIKTRDIALSEAQSLNLALSRSFYRQALTNTISPMVSNKDIVYTQGISAWTTSTKQSDPLAPQTAIPYFASIITQYPNSNEAGKARLNLGQIYSSLYYRLKKTNQLDESTKKNYLHSSIEAYMDFIRNSPNSPYVPQALKQIADCQHALLGSGNTIEKLQKSALTYKRIIDSYGDSSIASYAQMEYAGVLFELAVNNSLSWDSVRLSISRGLNTFAQTSSRRVLARLSVMYAETYFNQGNPEALRTFSQGVLTQYSDCTPEIAMAESWIARSYLDQQDYSTALSKCQSILGKYSDSQDNEFIPLVRQDCLYASACILMYNNNLTGAIQACDDLIQQYPDSKHKDEALRLKAVASGVSQ